MKTFTIPEDDWNSIVKLSREAADAPVMTVGDVDLNQSARERVVSKWVEIGRRVGFDGHSVEAYDQGERQIRAVAVEPKTELQEEVDQLSRQLSENHAAVHDPGDRFSEDALGRDGKAFIALAMEGTEASIQGMPFSTQITIESRRSRIVLSFESEEAATGWLEDQRSAILAPRYADGEL